MAARGGGGPGSAAGAPPGCAGPREEPSSARAAQRARLVIEWSGEGTLLSARRQGEAHALIEVFTDARGRHAGIVRGGASRRMAPTLQPGTQLALTWRARLDEHLGAFAVEPVRSRAAQVMGDRLALPALGSVCALLLFALPERAPHPRLYAATQALLDALGAEPGWPAAYLGWERLLLEETGYGLDLEACAVTGAAEGLAYVSPRTGRAVSEEGAGAYAERLLPLPRVLRNGEGDLADVLAGLAVTGHFLETRLAPALGDRALPEARARLLGALRREAARRGGRAVGGP